MLFVFCTNLKNIHPFCFPCASFVCEGRKEYSHLIIATLIFPSSCFCGFLLVVESVFDVALLSWNSAYVCDLLIEGCACRLVLYKTMKRSIFMHTSVLATAESAFVFTLYHIPLLLTPTSLHCALIPPRLSGFHPFTHSFLRGCDLCYVASLYIQLILRTKGCVCLGSSGRGGRQRDALKLSHRYKNQQRIGKYGLRNAGVRVGSSYRNDTHELM